MGNMDLTILSRRQVIAAGMAAALNAQIQPSRRVAITIDDGPVVGEMKSLENFQRISAGLITSLQAEKTPATVFINERQINVHNQRDGRAAVLAQWLDAGFDLGNHTYSHPSLNRAPLWQFQDDVVRGDVILRSLLAERGRNLVWFRYPFLHSGTTPEIHQGILDFLEQRNYRVAPVTVDYADYSFAGAYSRMRKSGDMELAEKIKQAYLDQIDVGFEHAEKVSLDLFGYEPPQILLIHCNELNSLTLRDSIARMRRRGYSFITLDEAMTDKIYQRPDSFTGPGGSWLSRTATAMGRPLPPGSGPRLPQWIADLAKRPTP